MNGKQRMAEQSKLWLWEALVRLMRRESYADITITQIAQEAQLSRRTFYRAFASKEELVDDFCKRFSDEYLRSLVMTATSQHPATVTITITHFFDFTWVHRDIIRLLIRQNLFDRLSNIWLGQATQRYDSIAFPWHVRDDDQAALYLMAASLGGLTNVMKLWLSKAKPEAPAALASMTMNGLDMLASTYADEQQQAQQAQQAELSRRVRRASQQSRQSGQSEQSEQHSKRAGRAWQTSRQARQIGQAGQTEQSQQSQQSQRINRSKQP